MSSKKTWPQWTNQPIELYHGTVRKSAEDIFADGVDTSRGRPNTDFGVGFYTTTSLTQARRWAENRAGTRSGNPAIVKLTLSRSELGSLRSLVFILGTSESTDFWSFVTHCRSGKQATMPKHWQYDVVYGPVASRWGPDEFETHSRFDQVSFHGTTVQRLLRDPNECKVEILE